MPVDRLQRSPEVPFGERVAGAGLEILLEDLGPAVVIKPKGNDAFPGSELSGIGAFAGVVIGQTRVKDRRSGRLGLPRRSTGSLSG